LRPLCGGGGISDGAIGIAYWFIDTDYNEGSFFVRHAHFLGANATCSALRSPLKALKSGRIAVKFINSLGGEVMKVFRLV